MIRSLVALAFVFVAWPAACLAADRVGPWDVKALKAADPKPRWGYAAGKAKEVFYTGEPLNGKPTNVYALYAKPEGDVAQDLQAPHHPDRERRDGDVEHRPGREREEEEQDRGGPAEPDQPGDVDGLHGESPGLLLRPAGSCLRRGDAGRGPLPGVQAAARDGPRRGERIAQGEKVSVLTDVTSAALCGQLKYLFCTQSVNMVD